MRLEHLTAWRYRSLREVGLDLKPLNLFIGANASGKSNILDALRFLSTALREKDFQPAVQARGGIIHLAWKGEAASDVHLVVSFRNQSQTFEWSVNLHTPGFGYAFRVDERVTVSEGANPPAEVLSTHGSEGWWWSNEANRKVPLEPLAPEETTCALGAAAADASFPARPLAEFVLGWGFFDPSPSNLRRDRIDDGTRLDPFGRNLAARLRVLQQAQPDTFTRVLDATRSVIGLPEEIELKETEEGHAFFVQNEPGLEFRVHQVGASSGTLRILALMTALLGESDATLVGIEEPENHIHPSALEAFAEHLREASQRIQILVTTHSPLLLDRLNDPDAVCVVTRTEAGTEVRREENPEAVQRALVESGFGLGELYETKGFGA